MDIRQDRIGVFQIVIRIISRTLSPGFISASLKTWILGEKKSRILKAKRINMKPSIESDFFMIRTPGIAAVFFYKNNC
jgi:hypothetical protein